MPSGCGGTGCCWYRPHIFGERDNTQSYSFPLFVSGGELRDRGLYYVEQSTQNPSVVFCIFRIPSRISDLIKWVVTDCVLFSSYHLHALCPGIFPPTAFSWEQGHHVSRDFSKGLLVMRTKNYTFVASGFHFSPKHFHLKDLSTYLHLFLHDICKKTNVSQNYHFFVMKLIRELSTSGESSAQRQL